jgi:hypothetical protein
MTIRPVLTPRYAPLVPDGVWLGRAYREALVKPCSPQAAFAFLIAPTRDVQNGVRN